MRGRRDHGRLNAALRRTSSRGTDPSASACRSRMNGGAAFAPEPGPLLLEMCATSSWQCGQSQAEGHATPVAGGPSCERILGSARTRGVTRVPCLASELRCSGASDGLTPLNSLSARCCQQVRPVAAPPARPLKAFQLARQNRHSRQVTEGICVAAPARAPISSGSRRWEPRSWRPRGRPGTGPVRRSQDSFRWRPRRCTLPASCAIREARPRPGTVPAWARNPRPPRQARQAHLT